MTDASAPDSPEILIVEDNEAICGLIKSVLERRGFRVPTFGDPLVALRFLDTEQPQIQLAIIDQNLPGLTGLNFARELRNRRPQVPLIITSGRNLAKHREELRELPGVKLLPKPFSLADLNRAVTDAVQTYGEAV